MPEEAFVAQQVLRSLSRCSEVCTRTTVDTLQVYAASALIEWHGEKADTVPRKIFELGLQSFEGIPDYVLTYADFLWGLGDYDNMRALFERALAADAKSKKLWDRYIQVGASEINLNLHETANECVPTAIVKTQKLWDKYVPTAGVCLTPQSQDMEGWAALMHRWSMIWEALRQ